MYDKARIEKINNNEINVVPLISEHCLSCSKYCSLEDGTPFKVSNPHNLTIYEGQFVTIRADRKAQLKQAFLALILPILFAVLSWFAVDTIALISGYTANEAFHILAVLLGLGSAVGVVSLLTHSRPPNNSYIESVEDTNIEKIRQDACIMH
ncbi:MAG TPA: SoxR reducing system RseC family protein [Treponemataceae bacterium]|nr:SoxR reducing system RseC family protein [Treponemataceae bacterium]